MIGTASVSSKPEPPQDAWRRVRSLRANPPGFAAKDLERRRVFGAALGQAEDLATAARGVGPESKPLLLFYSLSQAGRAISANCFEGPKWTHETHGLGVDEGPGFIAGFLIKPQKSGAFVTVCEATGSPSLAGPVTLGKLYSSMPELRGQATFDEAAPRCLTLRGQEASPPGTPFFELINRPRTLAVLPASEDRLAGALAEYPSASGYTIRRERIHTWDPQDTLSLEWPDAEEIGGRRPLDEIGMAWRSAYHLRPGLGGGEAPSALMSWWALLQGLSVAARYAPSEWVAALDPDRSPIATLLEETLEVAEHRVPQLIAEGIEAAARRRMKENLRERARSGGKEVAAPHGLGCLSVG